MTLFKSIKWMVKASKGCKTGIFFMIFVGLVHLFLTLSFIYLSKILVDIAVGKAEGDLSLYAFLMIITMLLQIFMRAIKIKIKDITVVKFQSQVRYSLFKHLMEVKWIEKNKFHSGDVVNRLEEDVRQISLTVCESFPETIVMLVQFIAALFAIIWYSPQLALLLVFILPLALVASRYHFRKVRKITHLLRETESKEHAHIQEQLQFSTVIKSLEYTQYSVDELKDIQLERRIQERQRSNYSLFSRLLIQFGFSAGYATVFIWSVFGLKSGAISFGIMTAFLQLVAQVQRPIIDLGIRLPKFIHSITATERLLELFNSPVEETGEKNRLSGAVGVKFENVDFAYNAEGRKILSNFSYNFLPGSKTAIVGQTGVGKSTLIRLIISLLVPDRGFITLYNNDMEYEASPKTRCNITYVPQGNTLLSGTIKDNLRLAAPNATEEQMKRALYISAAEFVLELPKGLDTECSEFGGRLSEGQAQRIAIARGLMRESNILILDEPTSALDENTQALLLDRLLDSQLNKTIIIITHRELDNRGFSKLKLT